MSHDGIRVCVIGAGPCGLFALYHLSKLKKMTKNVAEITCFEKQSEAGGLWNYTWRTGKSIRNKNATVIDKMQHV